MTKEEALELARRLRKYLDPLDGYDRLEVLRIVGFYCDDCGSEGGCWCKHDSRWGD